MSEMNYSWRKAVYRPVRALRPGLELDRQATRDFIYHLEKNDFTVVYIDE